MMIIIREPLVVGNPPTYCCCPQKEVTERIYCNTIGGMKK